MECIETNINKYVDDIWPILLHYNWNLFDNINYKSNLCVCYWVLYCKKNSKWDKRLIKLCFQSYQFCIDKINNEQQKRDIGDDEERTPLDIIKTRRSDMIPDGEAEKKLREIKQLKQEFKPL